MEPYFEQAIRLSPHEPGIAVWHGRVGVAKLLQSQTDEALVWLEQARSENARLPFVHAYLAAAYALKGDTERARKELAEAQQLSPGYASLAQVARIDLVRQPEDPGLCRGHLFSRTASRRLAGKVIRPGYPGDQRRG